jgi:uncharacterized protein YqfA (UPF0365 family)
MLGSIVIVILAIIFLVLFFSFVPLGLWISARASGVKIGILQLVGMRVRKVVPSRIVNPMIKATKAGLDVSINKLEAHYLAGGNVDRVINALIAAQRAGIPLGFEQSCAIDLAGRDVLQAGQMSVNPKVIETPVIAAVAMNGIELRAKARVTVRANIDRLVGGAGEETIIARIGEGIVTTVGSSNTHKDVLENPDRISRTVLDKGLDAGTAFEILSIDIADVDVGRNVGAQLQIDQAEADKRIAQAKAEERRAMAVAQEQENLAAVQGMRARVIEAEAEGPKAMAQAFREGNLGVMDYYRMKNIVSDTDMRNAIGKGTKPARPITRDKQPCKRFGSSSSSFGLSSRSLRRKSSSRPRSRLHASALRGSAPRRLPCSSRPSRQRPSVRCRSRPTVRPAQYAFEGTASTEGTGSIEGTGSLEGTASRDEGSDPHQIGTKLRQMGQSPQHVVTASSVSGHAHEETSMTGIRQDCPPMQSRLRRRLRLSARKARLSGTRVRRSAALCFPKFSGRVWPCETSVCRKRFQTRRTILEKGTVYIGTLDCIVRGFFEVGACGCAGRPARDLCGCRHAFLFALLGIRFIPQWMAAWSRKPWLPERRAEGRRSGRRSRMHPFLQLVLYLALFRVFIFVLAYLLTLLQGDYTGGLLNHIGIWNQTERTASTTSTLRKTDMSAPATTGS